MVWFRTVETVLFIGKGVKNCFCWISFFFFLKKNFWEQTLPFRNLHTIALCLELCNFGVISIDSTRSIWKSWHCNKICWTICTKNWFIGIYTNARIIYIYIKSSIFVLLQCPKIYGNNLHTDIPKEVQSWSNHPKTCKLI